MQRQCWRIGWCSGTNADSFQTYFIWNIFLACGKTTKIHILTVETFKLMNKEYISVRLTVFLCISPKLNFTGEQNFLQLLLWLSRLCQQWSDVAYKPIFLMDIYTSLYCKSVCYKAQRKINRPYFQLWINIALCENFNKKFLLFFQKYNVVNFISPALNQILNLWCRRSSLSRDTKEKQNGAKKWRNAIQTRNDQFDASNALKQIAHCARKFNAVARKQRQDSFENTEIYCHPVSLFSGQ